jgi:hypothetical protein
MDKMEYMLKENPSVTIGEYARTQRLCEVADGSEVRWTGRAYEVLRSGKSITLRPYQARTKFCATNRPLTFGINCQMWVEVVPVKKAVEPVVQQPAPVPPAEYTNLSGYLNVTKKLEEV